jgi:hypothetical protein
MYADPRMLPFWVIAAFYAVMSRGFRIYYIIPIAKRPTDMEGRILGQLELRLRC